MLTKMEAYRLAQEWTSTLFQAEYEGDDDLAKIAKFEANKNLRLYEALRAKEESRERTPRPSGYYCMEGCKSVPLLVVSDRLGSVPEQVKVECPGCGYAGYRCPDLYQHGFAI